MKVQVVAHELVDTDIEMVSLVRHGANRCPFKILKSDEEPATLGDKLSSLLSLGRDEANVVAYFVPVAARDRVLPVLKTAGVNIDGAVEADGVVVITVAEGKPRGFVQLNDNLAVAVDQPLKEFGDESVVKAYADSVGMQGFAPGVNMAVRGLAASVWSLLNSSDGSRDERIAKVDTLMVSFRKYIAALAKRLPEVVFKVESATQDVATEESEMTRPAKLTEVHPGDLEDLEKADEAPAEPVATAADPVEPVAKADEAPAEPAAAEPAAAAAPAEAVTKQDEFLAALQGIVAKALEPVTAKIDAVAATVATQGTTIESLVAKQEVVAKREAKTIPVHAAADTDLVLASLGGRGSANGKTPVEKTGEEVWDGLFKEFGSFRAR